MCRRTTSEKKSRKEKVPAKSVKQPANHKTVAGGRVNTASPQSLVETYMADGTLMCGDVVMLLATEASSDRIPWDQLPYLAAVVITSWVVTATAKGDYRGNQFDDFEIMSGLYIVRAIFGATATWAISTTLAILGYSFLVSHFLVNPELLVVSKEVSPQIEVIVAMLVTMTSWRGIAARLRL